MAQQQVVDINALYKIGQATNWQPDYSPQFMNIITKVLGGMAVDLLHDAWDTKRTRLRTNKSKLNNAADEIMENNVLSNLSEEVLNKQKEILRKANWGSEFALKGKKRRKKKDVVKQVGSFTKNYKGNLNAFGQHKENAQLQLNSTSDHGTHNAAPILHFNTLLGNGDLDALMSTDDIGNLYLSKEKVSATILGLDEEMKAYEATDGANLTSDMYISMAKQKQKYERLLTSSMKNNDYYMSQWQMTQKDESNILRDQITEYRNEIIPGRVESSSDGVWAGAQEDRATSDVRNFLKGDPNDPTWGNKVNSYWFDETYGPSLAHLYITQSGGFTIDGIKYNQTVDPFQFDNPNEISDSNPDKYSYEINEQGFPVQKEGPDGVADIMQQYIGVMEMMKTQELNSGEYGDFAVEQITAMAGGDFDYLWGQKNKTVTEMSGPQIQAAESNYRADEVNKIIQGGITYESLNSLTGIKGVTSNRNGTFTIIDQDGYEVTIDPSKDSAFNRDILYRAVGVTAISKSRTQDNEFDVDAHE